VKAVISEEKAIKLVPDKRHPNMYRLQWKDGSTSVKYYDPEDPMDHGGPNSYGMYNLTRAKDILKNYNEYIRVMRLSKNSHLLSSKRLAGELST